MRLALVLGTALSPVGALADTLPTGGSVVHGTATISTPNATSMTIHQGSDRAVVNWDGFSIGAGSRVDIHQPDANAAILNRVTGDTTSQIHGQLNANGRVFVVNPNGIFIGPTGTVNAGGFVASTLGIRTDDFVTGTTVFEGDGTSATVSNAGNIEVVTGGYAALIGGKVRNSGTIQAPLGFVGLGSGERITLDLAGDGFLQVAVPTESGDDGLEALIENSGSIQANGGTVQLSAATARNAARQAINMSGVVEARSVSGRNGRVTLGGGAGGKVTVGGTVRTATRPAIQVTESARPALRPDRGGDITITGRDITLTGAEIDASGTEGGGSIRIGGEYMGGAGLPTADTLTVDQTSTIRADAGTTGDGGRVILWSDLDTKFAGNISIRGGDLAGNGGFAEVSGKVDLTYRGFTDGRAPNGKAGELLLDPTDIEIVASGAGVNQILNTNLQAALGSASVTIATSGTGATFLDAGEDGTIIVDAPISWDSNTFLTLAADQDVIVDQPITATAGDLTLIAENAIRINAGISVANGDFILGGINGAAITTGPGGTIDVGLFRLAQGAWEQNSAVLPSFRADNFVIGDLGTPAPSFLRALGGDGSEDAYRITDVYGLQGIGTVDDGTRNYQLANDIDASGTSGWESILTPSGGFLDAGFVPYDFGGILNGNRHTISDLFIQRYAETSGSDNTGLFDTITGTVTQLNIANADVRGPTVGILAAENDGFVTGVSVSGTVQVYGEVGGGIVGINTGEIRDSSANVIVSDTEDFPSVELADIGGIAGQNLPGGRIVSSKSTGSLSLASVDSGYIGGIAGLNRGVILNAYSTASVFADTSSGMSAYVGGIAGENGGTITNVIANGLVGASNSGMGALVGGIVGSDNPEIQGIISSYWNPLTTGQPNSGQIGPTGTNTSGPFDGARPQTTAQLNDAVAFFNDAGSAGWNFFSVWSLPQDGTDHARLYSVDPVISAFGFDPFCDEECDFDQGPLTFQYNGTTTGFSASGSYYGGPGDYLFGPIDDGGNRSDMDDQIVLSGANVGPQTFTFPTSFVSDLGQMFSVRSFPSDVTITPAPLVVTINETQKQFGNELGFSGVSFSAATLFGSDRITSGDVISSGSGADAPITQEGYSLSLANLDGPGLSNYNISVLPGILRVILRSIDVQVNDGTKTYGETLAFDGTEFTAVGLLNDDTLTSLTITSEGAAPGAQVSDTPYDIIGTDPVGTGLGNYVINILPGRLTVVPAPLTITANNQSKPFGTEFVFEGNEFTVTGLFNDDTVESATLTSTAAAADAPFTGEDGVAIVITDPTGVGLDNYTVQLVNGVMIIAPGNLTIRANDQSKVYGTAFTFDGTEFTVTGLAEGDSVDSVTLTSAGADATAQVADGPFGITASDAVGTGLDKYTLIFADGSFTVVPAPLTVTANDQSKQQGQLFTFAGTEFTTSGLLNNDSVDTAVLTSAGAAAEALADDSPFAINLGALTGTGLSNYQISRVNGTFEVQNQITPPIVNPIPPGSASLGNPRDIINIGFAGDTRIGGLGGPQERGGTGGPTQSLPQARETNNAVDAISTELELQVQSCGSADQDFTNYMACLSESLDTYANALDQIANDLPAGLENVSAIIRTASDEVKAATARAQTRLAGATSDAERRAIQRDAVNEARGAIETAKSEIRKAIALIRADDPEVTAVQRDTGARIIQAFDTVDSALVRAVEL